MDKMKDLDTLIEEYYEKFVGLPANCPIVRSNQKNDAFEIVVLETLYGKEKDINVSKMTASDIEKISKFIVPPPDEGVDIIIEREEIDDNFYDFIQVKNSVLSPLEIKKELHYMEDTVAQYLKKPSSLNSNLRNAMGRTSFSSSDKTNCRFILVHRGDINSIKNQKESETIITTAELEAIRDGNLNDIPKVRQESFGADSFNNFIIYEEAPDNPAILMNLCGYDLARLANKYNNTMMGRNILFGQNLRDSLVKSSTYDGMKNTIQNEPEKFWFYNNGITIITDDYDTTYDQKDKKKIERLVLKGFSIINGAQTTSALGRFYNEAESEEEKNLLKRVFVLARVLKVNDRELKDQIAVFNNTQNPITTRDMASRREEQRRLYNYLIGGNTPNIYVEIRRGAKIPADVRLYKHQVTTNVELAQLAFAGFLRNPFNAKDKKNSIFDTDYKNPEYLVNEHYQHIFNYSEDDEKKGVLFKKTKEEIDELLFVHYLYKESKKALVNEYKIRIEQFTNSLETCDDGEERKNLENKISNYESLKSIANSCVFYCMAYYYSFKNEFANTDAEVVYRYKDFYSDKEFQNRMIISFRDMFLTGTVTIIKELSSNSLGSSTWLRDKKSTVSFIAKTEDNLQLDLTLKDKYTTYVEEYKS